jgi:hypothetical protein
MCVCAPGLMMCSGTCLNTQFDRNNCGACGAVCASNQLCNLGMCVTP